MRGAVRVGLAGMGAAGTALAGAKAAPAAPVRGTAQVVLKQGPQPDFKITPETRSEVIEAAMKRLREQYIYPETAEKMAKALREREQRKEYDGITSGQELVRERTRGGANPGGLAVEHVLRVAKDEETRRRIRMDLELEGDEPSAESKPAAKSAPAPGKEPIKRPLGTAR